MNVDELLEISKDFKKRELLQIAEDLELDVKPSIRSAELIGIIIKDLEDNGLPTEQDTSDLMHEFLVSSEFLDEDGNIIEEDEEEDEPIKKPVKNPDCWGYADRRDPSCRRCKLLEMCEQERIRTRPDCFGKLYKSTDEQCLGCIEAINCKKEKNDG